MSKPPIPKSVMIGHNRVRIVLDASLLSSATSFGEYDTEKKQIALNPTQRSEEMPNTLLHEIMHGIYDAYDLREAIDIRDPEEHLVTLITNATIQVFLFNPEFLNWFTAHIKEQQK